MKLLYVVLLIGVLGSCAADTESKPPFTCYIVTPPCPPLEHIGDPTVNCYLVPTGKPCPYAECVCDPVKKDEGGN
ncbi:hypothetical protein JTE90_008584 [Oedothorax gibbosus]|uniref:Uncharacterized protein n=1 Tax=Oedothorax gibbosus TaxID=931172 RepID=A0AAV6U9K7_9ARAC|nr:hypothetical protein JTE90_008584 [Oedothorax gibbosus]